MPPDRPRGAGGCVRGPRGAPGGAFGCAPVCCFASCSVAASLLPAPLPRLNAKRSTRTGLPPPCFALKNPPSAGSNGLLLLHSLSEPSGSIIRPLAWPSPVAAAISAAPSPGPGLSPSPRYAVAVTGEGVLAAARSGAGGTWVATWSLNGVPLACERLLGAGAGGGDGESIAAAHGLLLHTLAASPAYEARGRQARARGALRLAPARLLRRSIALPDSPARLLSCAGPPPSDGVRVRARGEGHPLTAAAPPARAPPGARSSPTAPLPNPIRVLIQFSSCAWPSNIDASIVRARFAQGAGAFTAATWACDGRAVLASTADLRCHVYIVTS